MSIFGPLALGAAAQGRGSRRYASLRDTRRQRHLPFPLSAGARSHQQVLRVLGMDCLRHHCLQLDSQNRAMRFLASAPTNTAEVGARRSQ